MSLNREKLSRFERKQIIEKNNLEFFSSNFQFLQKIRLITFIIRNPFHEISIRRRKDYRE